MLVARPLVDPEKFSLFQGQKTHHLVLLDDSGSMRDRADETSAFDAALDVVRKIAAEGERKPDTQTLTLLLSSNPTQPVYTQENLNKDFVGRSKGSSKGCAVRTARSIWRPGPKAARKMLADLAGAARNFHLISDFRQDRLGRRYGPGRRPSRNGSRQGDGQSRQDGGRIARRTWASPTCRAPSTWPPLTSPCDFRSRSETTESKSAREVRLTVLVDGQKRPATETIEKIEPGQERTIEFDEQFPRTGPHDVQVSLPADALEQDNVRYLSIQVPDTNPVLVIDGGVGRRAKPFI